MRVLVPMGTRPEIVKLAPVVRALLDDDRFVVRTLATGQHYDPELTDTFYGTFGLEPDDRWTLPTSEAQRMGEMLTLASVELAARRPDVVLVLGDTHTVPLFCLAARNARIPVAHLEAGLRSFNPTSVEEVNRRVAATTASLHFAPTDLAARFLEAEGIPAERVRVVGNPVVDALRDLGARPGPISARAGAVVTVHRATNVDNRERLGRVVDIVAGLARQLQPVWFPIHPRTRARLEEHRLMSRLDRCFIHVLPPVPYARMLELIAGAKVVVTDSGGLQEEAAWLRVPTVVLRQSTPRWEGVAAGTSVLAGLDVEMAVAAALEMTTPACQVAAAAVPCPYGDGNTAARVVEILADPSTRSLLQLEEPDFVGQCVPT
jgi:UDP-N-acetylglucosamine 2-epimerase (non-hydrolysing)